MVEPIAPIAPIADPAVPVVTPIVPVAPVVPVTPPQYFGADGVLNEGWQSTLPEGYRDEKSLSTVNDAKVLAKMFVDTKRMVGQDTIKMPNDTSTEADWDAFHKAGGRPETVADYNLKAPDGFPQELVDQVFPAARVTAWQERFFKGGVSQKAANEFIAGFAQDMIADHQAMVQAETDAKALLWTNLTTELGAARDQKLHLGDMAIEDFTGGDEAMKESLSHLRKDPLAVRMMIHFGGLLAEGKPPGFGAVPTPNDLQEQINTLMADPILMSKDSTPAQRKPIMDKIMAIRAKMKPEPATT